ncbi:hypothetical protein T01_2835 [Trichinella spiralis]|uniref:Uncharacterized protein n=1 Tax=Trichinella spiralis TaxID=6334 RepID=A0A0V1BVW1_TRISP|nr:hypothetical protein T01_2835 [Trichinella spiralis]
MHSSIANSSGTLKRYESWSQCALTLLLVKFFVSTNLSFAYDQLVALDPDDPDGLVVLENHRELNRVFVYCKQSTYHVYVFQETDEL